MRDVFVSYNAGVQGQGRYQPAVFMSLIQPWQDSSTTWCFCELIRGIVNMMLAENTGVIVIGGLTTMIRTYPYASPK